MIHVESAALSALGTNSYLLHDAQEAILIDAPEGALETFEPILQQKQLRLSAVWLTHGHFDHILGLKAFSDLGVEVLAHPLDRILIENPQMQMERFGMPAKVQAGQVTRWIEPPLSLKAFGQEVEVRAVPGHCPGSLLFYFSELGLAFCGDAIFAGSIGRTDLPGGDFDTLKTSILNEIYTLPELTQLYPGHGPVTTVRVEKHSNGYVRAQN
jgi:glyoxylase-like metal-dependent hydrolase (beta-lactamase superfamily II)